MLLKSAQCHVTYQRKQKCWCVEWLTIPMSTWPTIGKWSPFWSDRMISVWIFAINAIRTKPPSIMKRISSQRWELCETIFRGRLLTWWYRPVSQHNCSGMCLCMWYTNIWYLYFSQAWKSFEIFVANRPNVSRRITLNVRAFLAWKMPSMCRDISK